MKNDLFDELNVTELEERLELADRCLCRVGKEVEPAEPTELAPAPTQPTLIDG